jgi:hypothetical protein
MQPLKSVANSNQPHKLLQLAAFATGSCCVSIARYCAAVRGGFCIGPLTFRTTVQNSAGARFN